MYCTYLAVFIRRESNGVVCNLTVAVWVKTYSLYVAALQRLTASKQQTTGFNFDPNVVTVFVSNSHDVRNCDLA